MNMIGIMVSFYLSVNGEINLYNFIFNKLFNIFNIYFKQNKYYYNNLIKIKFIN